MSNATNPVIETTYYNAENDQKGSYTLGKVANYAVDLVNRAILEAGGPENLVVTVEKPTKESSDEMMASPVVKMLVATGGPGVVKTLLSSGKKAIGAGAGNPPVIVDDTVVQDILDLAEIAPLHNKGAVMGINGVREITKDIPNVVVFDNSMKGFITPSFSGNSIKSLAVQPS